VTNKAEPHKIGAMKACPRFKFLFECEITLNALWAMDYRGRRRPEERKGQLRAQIEEQ